MQAEISLAAIMVIILLADLILKEPHHKTLQTGMHSDGDTDCPEHTTGSRRVFRRDVPLYTGSICGENNTYRRNTPRVYAIRRMDFGS